LGKISSQKQMPSSTTGHYENHDKAEQQSFLPGDYAETAEHVYQD
jgi:hypothetical protein